MQTTPERHPQPYRLLQQNNKGINMKELHFLLPLTSIYFVHEVYKKGKDLWDFACFNIPYLHSPIATKQNLELPSDNMACDEI
jgi:hypothetical protein